MLKILLKLKILWQKWVQHLDSCEFCGKPYTCVEIASEGGLKYCKNCFKKRDLIYAATARCPCGAGLAYKSDMDYWECSKIILNTADIKATHTAKLPFAFWEIKSELQPSASGKTTRESV